MTDHGARIVAEAEKWLGTPFHHQGRVRGVGVDCAMLLCEVYHTCGLIPYIDPTPYSQDWHLHREDERYIKWITQHAQLIDTPQPGDIALYQFARSVSHGAIIVEWPQIIHANNNEGVVRGLGNAGTLRNRLRGFYRVVK